MMEKLSHSYFISDDTDYAESRLSVDNTFDVNASLPDLVFRGKFNQFQFEEFDWTLSADFWGFVRRISSRYQDRSALLAVLEPSPEAYYKPNFGYYNWAEIPVDLSPQEYWTIINAHPDNSFADSILANSHRIVWLAPSGKWAIWADRSFEIAILATVEVGIHSSWHSQEWATEYIPKDRIADQLNSADFHEKFLSNYA